jgi:hypothetical protein
MKASFARRANREDYLDGAGHGLEELFELQAVHGAEDAEEKVSRFRRIG